MMKISFCSPERQVSNTEQSREADTVLPLEGERGVNQRHLKIPLMVLS